MIRLENEEDLWQSKNQQLLLTTHRLREMKKSYFGSTIKSIMLEELASCELRIIRRFGLLKQAVIYFFLINGSVYLLNNFLFKAEIIKFFFDEVHIGPETATQVLYFSIIVALLYVIIFFLSARKVFSFYATGVTINAEVRRLKFDERENLIGMIEMAKDKRRKNLNL